MQYMMLDKNQYSTDSALVRIQTDQHLQALEHMVNENKPIEFLFPKDTLLPYSQGLQMGESSTNPVPAPSSPQVITVRSSDLKRKQPEPTPCLRTQLMESPKKIA
ncbi:hypothetical protein LIER_27099 [Lithospermum erythrorhizon]|uniref:Uncharacterized protein n=1 Tax=Lithospermum erythrorhizon TaxID=34254 RepID=A0AAV3RAV9_LITER